MASLSRIFETDPDAAPKPGRFKADTVGRFRAGRMVGRTPESLSEWRVTTGDPEVASAIVQLYGGVAEEWETTGEDGLEVLTNATTVRIVVDGSRDLKADMRQYANSMLFHHCDGVEFISPEEKRGEACGCPPLFQDRKDLARSGGPKPNIDLRFRLAEDVDLGYFRFVSSSWDLVRELATVGDALDATDAPKLCDLTIEPVEFTAKRGPRAGKLVSYSRPVITVVRDFDPDDAPF